MDIKYCIIGEQVNKHETFTGNDCGCHPPGPNGNSKVWQTKNFSTFGSINGRKSEDVNDIV